MLQSVRSDALSVLSLCVKIAPLRVLELRKWVRLAAGPVSSLPADQMLRCSDAQIKNKKMRNSPPDRLEPTIISTSCGSNL